MKIRLGKGLKQQPKKQAAAKAEVSSKTEPKTLEKSHEMSLVLNNSVKIADLEKKIAELKAQNSDLLKKVVVLHGASFKFGARYYSIRARGGTHFFVSSDVPVGSWNKKAKK